MLAKSLLGKGGTSQGVPWERHGESLLNELGGAVGAHSKVAATRAIGTLVFPASSLSQSFSLMICAWCGACILIRAILA